MAKQEDKMSAEAVVKHIRRETRRKHSAEEKIRIVLEGIRGEASIAELCRREGINPNLYYKWSKEFLEAGKARLQGDTKREATSSEVSNLRQENEDLKAVVAEPGAEKKLAGTGSGGQRMGQLMRYSAAEKYEIIQLVENANLPVKQTLAELDVPRSTFYRWYQRYQHEGYAGLEDQKPQPRQFWNRIPEPVQAQVVQMALEQPEKSPRELAWYITDTQGYFISETELDET